MATSASQAILTGLSHRLVADKILDESAMMEVVMEARSLGQSLVSHLVDKEIADAGTVATAASQEFGS